MPMALRRRSASLKRSSKFAQTGEATQGLLTRLREIGGFKPWGAIVYDNTAAKWAAAWNQSRAKTPSRARDHHVKRRNAPPKSVSLAQPVVPSRCLRRAGLSPRATTFTIRGRRLLTNAASAGKRVASLGHPVPTVPIGRRPENDARHYCTSALGQVWRAPPRSNQVRNSLKADLGAAR